MKYFVEFSPFPASTYIPTLAKCSIISDEELNCQVRNGAGCVLLSIDTKKREIKINNNFACFLLLSLKKLLF